MILHHYFTSATLSNTYLLGAEGASEIALIDPTAMDIQLLRLIESRDTYVTRILLTHPPANGCEAVKTLLKIYDASLYGSADHVLGLPCTRVEDHARIEIAGIEIEVIDVSGMENGALMFRCDHLLFTGDLLGAGKILAVRRLAPRRRLAMLIRSRIAGIDPWTVVLPAAGPPSTVGAELAFNPFLRV